VNYLQTLLPGRGNIDVFIVKFDAFGERLWAKSAGGNQDDVGYFIAVDP